MIQHYIDCGLEEYLPSIYERCCADEVLSPDNRPIDLWQKDNLIEKNKFYLHKELVITNSPPVIDVYANKIIESNEFKEVKEKYTIQDLLRYASMTIKRSELSDEKHDAGTINYLLAKYNKIQINVAALDIVLFLISHHKNKRMKLIDISTDEDIVIKQVLAYDEKLKRLGKHSVKWRGALSIWKKNSS